MYLVISWNTYYPSRLAFIEFKIQTTFSYQTDINCKKKLMTHKNQRSYAQRQKIYDSARFMAEILWGLIIGFEDKKYLVQNNSNF